MAIIKYKPTSPGRRFQSVSDFAEITSSEPVKSLLKPVKKTGGRNSYGRITARHIGGGHKRKYRMLISGAIRRIFRLKLPLLNTIRTGRLESHC